jgi:AraC-like DNA-binding protein
MILPDKLSKANVIVLDQFSDEVCSYLDRTSIRHKKIIDEIQRYIESNYMNDIGLTDLSQAIGYTPVYINRILKSSNGTTFYENLTQYRIKQAQVLLTNSDMSIKSISIRLDISTHKAFCACTRKLRIKPLPSIVKTFFKRCLEYRILFNPRNWMADELPVGLAQPAAAKPIWLANPAGLSHANNRIGQEVHG